MDIQKGCWMPASGWGLHRAIGDGDMPLISTDHEIASSRARGSQWTRAFGDRKEEDSFLSDARDRHVFRRNNAAVRQLAAKLHDVDGAFCGSRLARGRWDIHSGAQGIVNQYAEHGHRSVVIDAARLVRRHLSLCLGIPRIISYGIV